MRHNRSGHFGGGVAHRHWIQMIGLEQGDQRGPVDFGIGQVESADIDDCKFVIEKIGYAAGHMLQGGIEYRRIGFVQDGGNRHYRGYLDFDRLAGLAFWHRNVCAAA